MAEEMKGKHWDAYGPKKWKGNVRYPWDQWLNGSMWLLVQGDDFRGKTRQDTERFRNYIYNYADWWGIKVKTKLHENGRDLYIKAHLTTNRDGLDRSRHFRNLRRNREAREVGIRTWFYEDQDHRYEDHKNKDQANED